jgi:hypothetical protein
MQTNHLVQLTFFVLNRLNSAELVRNPGFCNGACGVNPS